ncbi:ATP-grasp domain-containing protein [Methylotetracoccus oryzae]|uniref:ATP-grasp domain-containing protein n=1 Tax=Methylotetracoccus oryzae TaxID=1919059 RepID=UPI001F186ACE|nr:ATP-grasp domain-containing protein [Methylotetracoccus oryzae]
MGVSVRMLAQSCSRAGIDALALDWFADTDTIACSQACAAIAAADRPDFDAQRLFAASERLAPSGSGTALVTAGGFDSRPELLEALIVGRSLYGNAPDTLRRIKTPGHFFGLLDELGIPYPATQLDTATTAPGPGRWLIKHRASEGGIGVQFFTPARAIPPDCYLQQHLDAPAHSLLFLANGTDIAPVGFNRLLTAGHRRDRPMLFGGALTPTTLPPAQRRAVCRYARDLTRALGLVGLNSLDFIHHGGQCHVLELNPRPSATLCLHDPNYRQGLLAAHLDACRGSLAAASVTHAPPRGFRVVYAERQGRVPPGINWPDWAADRPSPGTVLSVGDPLCSVSASAASLPVLERRLFTRERLIRAALML